MKGFKNLLVPTLALASYANAWALDQRCTDLGHNKLVTKAMDDAFELAQSGLDAWNALNGGTYNQAEIDLLENMFAWAVTNDNGQKSVNTGHAQWTYIQDIFQGVLDFKAPSKSPPRATDLIVYCDYSRYIENEDCKQNKKPGYACDTASKKEVKMDMAWKGCKSVKPFPVMAMTDLNNFFAAQIDICSWYLDFFTESKEQFSNSIHGWGKVVKPFQDLFNKITLRTQIDFIALFDHTMLHEMTHAVKRFPGDHDTQTDDSGGDFGSYGWSNCVKLGKSSNPNAYKNAESFAYFGLVARLINPPSGEGGVTATTKGEVIKLTSEQTQRNQGNSLKARYERNILPAGASSSNKPHHSGTVSSSHKPSSVFPSGSVHSGPSANPTSGHHTGQGSSGVGGPTGPSSTGPSSTPSITSAPPTPSSSGAAIPSTVIPVTNGDSTTQVTYVSTRTSSEGGQPTGVWKCTGPLCDLGSKCIIPIFCADQPGSGTSWGLCCSWQPHIPSLGGGGPPAGGPEPGPPEGDDNNHSSDSSNSDSSTSTDSSSTSGSSSSCSATVASTCDVTISSYTPYRASTITTTTITQLASGTAIAAGGTSIYGQHHLFFRDFVQEQCATEHSLSHFNYFKEWFRPILDTSTQLTKFQVSATGTVNSFISASTSVLDNSTQLAKLQASVDGTSRSFLSDSSPIVESTSRLLLNPPPRNLVVGIHLLTGLLVYLLTPFTRLHPRADLLAPVPFHHTPSSAPSPQASCAMWSEIAAFMFVVYDIQNWNVNFADIESSLKKQEGGCGDITAWDFSDSTTYGVAAKFNLPTLIAAGCVERAIESAGGPSSSDVSCQGHGTHVFDGGDSVQDILNDL
ncbi:hypothetical protein N7474_006848 [Penicillium riverlandense]|uniref:uncharacterized protein n=1 Tax=Penicillium riverlandense TaxID=1903569 RepID=UPI002549C09D|nr:uncharacterized protein N7474_006848 [Penicillium riverlandense]KAJ5815071.1 hypothetical protein N7474_006848 [Penicillium riverlandense]